MTPAQRALQMGHNATKKWRGVDMTEQPDAKALTCIAVESVTEKLRQQLQIMDAEIDHVLHFFRADLVAQAINNRNVTGFDRGDTSQTYRVKYFKDDPQSLKVLFFCVSA